MLPSLSSNRSIEKDDEARWCVSSDQSHLICPIITDLYQLKAFWYLGDKLAALLEYYARVSQERHICVTTIVL